MNISINGRHVTVHDDLKELIAKKLAKFDRFFPNGADASVTLRRVRENECMEITISVNGTLFRAEESTSSFQNSLTKCVDTIEGQIRKNKTRLEKRMRGSFVTPAPSAGETAIEEEGAIDIRTKRFCLKPMTVEEAILQMNLLGHTFYVFENADSGETCIVYKRNAGSYGLIVPDKNV